MSKSDFDPHLDLALAAGAITKQEMQDYKDGNKTDAMISIKRNFIIYTLINCKYTLDYVTKTMP